MTIPYNWRHRFENVIENPIDKVMDNLSVNERNVLLILQKNPKATHEEIGRQIGLGPTSVYKIIASLRKKAFSFEKGRIKKATGKSEHRINDPLSKTASEYGIAGMLTASFKQAFEVEVLKRQNLARNQRFGHLRRGNRKAAGSPH